MMPHSNFGYRIRSKQLVSWRDMRGQKALLKAHQEALDENARREAEKKNEVENQ